VSEGTILKRWREKGLSANFEKGRRPRFPEAIRKKVFEAHDKKMSVHSAAEYADVSENTVCEYWREAGRRPHYKDLQEFRCEFDGKEVIFDSYGERIVGILLNYVGLVDRFDEGENLHVRTNGNKLNSIDFLVDDIFIEYHPLSILDKKKGMTLEEAGQKKRDHITNPVYKDNGFYHIWQIAQLYDVLKTERVNALLPDDCIDLSRDEFDVYVELAHERAADYDAKRDAEKSNADLQKTG
jgi:hypothetical protein